MNPMDLVLARNFNMWNYAASISDEKTALVAAKAWLLMPNADRRSLCPHCREPMSVEVRADFKVGFRWRCRRRSCTGGVISPSTNTFFEKSKLSVLKTMRLIFHFFRRDLVTVAARDVGVEVKTAIQIYHYLREVCEVAEAHDRGLIGGTDDVVEVDETHLYTNKYHRGRLLHRQTWSFGCISRLTKNVHVELIADKSRQTLDAIIQANVKPGTFIMSDMHRAYLGVDTRLGMRGHATVNHSIQFVNGTIDTAVNPTLGTPVAGSSDVRVKVHTNTIERQWLELKRHCRSCRSTRRLKWYMGEYMYRQNILKTLPSEAAMFRRLLRDIHRVYPGFRKRGIKTINCRCSPNCPRA